MTKFKPLIKLEKDVKEGDLVRLIGTSIGTSKPEDGKSTFETTGYFEKFSHEFSHEFAYFHYSPNFEDETIELNDVGIQLNLKSGDCHFYHKLYHFDKELITNYEILRRNIHKK